jgi:hypothetical protein
MSASWTRALLNDIDHAARLATDLPFAAAELLRIRPKSGGLVPLIFNDA